MVGNQTRILIIDDSQIVLDKLNKFFAKLGCEVFTALSEAEGLALAKQHDFTVALINMVMPSMNGEKILIKMKKIDPTIPVIMTTGSNYEQEAKKCMELGAYDYIHKPFDLEYLKTSVLSTELFIKAASISCYFTICSLLNV